MSQPTFVLSSCGTSLLTNVSRSPEERKLLVDFANLGKREQASKHVGPCVIEIFERARQVLLNADPDSVAPLSAELNTSSKYYGGGRPAKQDYHLLLCSDTWIGEESANLLAHWLRQYVTNVEVKRQRDLQTGELQAFQLALSDLVQWCEATLPLYRDHHYRIVFNLTGGFKSVQGFLQTLAMFYADEANYVFESGHDLLRIPRLPIEITAGDSIRQYLLAFRRLAAGLESRDTAGIPETFLMRAGTQIALSPWGSIVWERTRKDIYRSRLWPSPSPRITFSKRFESTAASLEADRVGLINERMDDLARCIESDRRYNIRSLDFKALKGDLKAPSTHEMDAWSDRDARRIFGHFEGLVFEVDEIGEGLH